MSYRDSDNLLYNLILVDDNPEPVIYTIKIKNPNTNRIEKFSTKIRVGEEWLIQEMTKIFKCVGYELISFKPAA